MAIGRGFAEKNPGPLLVVDLQGDLLYMNPASSSFLKKQGKSDADYRDILPPGFVDIFNNCLEAGVSIPVTRIEYPGSVILWTSYFSSSGEEVLYHGVDITRLHRNEVALREAKEKAEEGEKLKAAFLDNMSHEIRTPLNSLLGFMTLLSDELREKLSEDQQFYFDLIQQNGDRLARTMQEILDISHFSSGTYELKKDTHDIHAIVRDQVDRLAPFAEQKGLNYKIDIPEGELLTITDDYCLEQAVQHLLDNAVKYTDEGEVSISIAVEDGSGVIRIEDTGPGMDDETQRRIFMAFSQGSMGHSKHYQGIGLGLSLVRVYLDAIGATVDLDSRMGAGSKFKLSIPLPEK